jgi:hypothetical protein
MTGHSPDSLILEQEQWTIELLSRETHTTIARVREVFLEEYQRLAEGARIKAFLPLLAGNLVRVKLTAQKAGSDDLSKP